jgi:hypothetical protein
VWPLWPLWGDDVAPDSCLSAVAIAVLLLLRGVPVPASVLWLVLLVVLRRVCGAVAVCVRGGGCCPASLSDCSSLELLGVAIVLCYVGCGDRAWFAGAVYRIGDAAPLRDAARKQLLLVRWFCLVLSHLLLLSPVVG